jgi:hypothetical protein
VSTTPEPVPAAEPPPAPAAQPEPAEPDAPEAQEQPPAPAPSDAARRAALVFDDPLSRQSSDDTDRGWGERPTSSAAERAADLARFLDEKPPHHL